MKLPDATGDAQLKFTVIRVRKLPADQVQITFIIITIIRVAINHAAHKRKTRDPTAYQMGHTSYSGHYAAHHHNDNKELHGVIHVWRFN